MDISEIKSLYAEFVGYLDQAPSIKESRELYDEAVWKQYNNSIEKLMLISERGYQEFFIQPENSGYLGLYISNTTYRMKLGGLISKLRAEYFEKSPEPNAEKTGVSSRNSIPNIVITQTQQQNQQVFLQMILDVQSKIDEKLPALQEGSKEKTFFQKLKGSLSATTGVIDLLGKIFTLAKECGVPTEELHKLFT